MNAALNYGYGILLSAFAREVVINGYCTQLGIFHDNMFNQFNLARDLMEPFRPFIDMTVRDLGTEKFDRAEKLQVIQTLNNQVCINGKQQYMLNAIRIYTKSVLDALDGNDISLMRFPS